MASPHPSSTPPPDVVVEECSSDADELDEELQDGASDAAWTYSAVLGPADPLQSCAASASVGPSLGVKSISFSGCGAFYPYMYGIACYLQDHYDLSETQFLGTSGGCLPALTLATGLDVRQSMFSDWNNHVIAESARKPLKAYFSFIDICRKHAENYFPADIHERANGRLHISTTRVCLRPTAGWSVWNAMRAVAGGLKLLRNERISAWNDKLDLIHCVAASTYIPILDRAMFKSWRGEWWLDGGLTDNQPVLDGDTLRLQPFMFWQASALMKASFAWIRLSPLWHANLFLQGYQHAQENAATFAAFPLRAQKETRPVLPDDLAELVRLSKLKGASAQVAPANADDTHHHFLAV